MRLYHSSSVAVDRPEIRFSRDYLDFGKGFYLTALYDQAEKYARRFKRRKQSAWLSTFEFNYETSSWKILEFAGYDRNWLHFVTNCRAGKDDTDYDLIIGGVANDQVIRTIDRYFAGELSEEQALGLLKYEKPNNQFCIRSQKMLEECLKHIKSEEL